MLEYEKIYFFLNFPCFFAKKSDMSNSVERLSNGIVTIPYDSKVGNQNITTDISNPQNKIATTRIKMEENTFFKLDLSSWTASGQLLDAWAATRKFRTSLASNWTGLDRPGHV